MSDKRPEDSQDTAPATPKAKNERDARERVTKPIVESSESVDFGPVIELEPASPRGTVGFEDAVRTATNERATAARPGDPRAIAPTIDSVPEGGEEKTTPGFGAVHCPECGAFAHHVDRCPDCGYIFEDPRIGTIVGGRYRVESLLGAGGFGRVYRGVHLTIGEPVAIKFLLEEFSGRTELRARFKREAVALARIRHPNIVSVHDYGEHLGELYMVMELIRGRPLYDVLHEPGASRMPAPRACALIDQVLAVLEVAHGLGIVHRDLKGENVMLLDTPDRVEHVKVLDFGIALMEDQPGGERLTATRAVQGTPVYMSPEQCRGRDVGPPTDIYATGVLLFELLAQRPPFEASSAPEIMTKHMFVEPPTFAEVGVSDVPAGVEAIVRRALAKKAEDRPTARAFREALARALAGEDEASRREREVEQRVEHAALTREQRALVNASAAHAAKRSDSLAPPAAEGEMPRAYLWGRDALRLETLRSALAVHGVNGAVWKSDAPPDAVALAKRPAKALVIVGAGSIERVRAARAAEATSKLPVLVIEPDGTTPEVIRAGASDVAATFATDEAICKQVVRLIRRGR